MCVKRFKDADGCIIVTGEYSIERDTLTVAQKIIQDLEGNVAFEFSIQNELFIKWDTVCRQRRLVSQFAPDGVFLVEWTSHLKTHFPELGSGPLRFGGSTVAEVLASLDQQAPGIEFYVCDELGRLRRHVNIFVDGEMIVDRRRLSDQVGDGTRVLIMQALSGG